MSRLPHLTRICILAASLLALAWLGGCSPLVQVEQPTISAYFPVEGGKSVGQTFTARYDGLEGIAIFLRPETTGEGSLRLQLERADQPAEVIAQAELPLAQVDGKGFYRFRFPPLEDSQGKDYSFTVDLIGEGSVRAGISSAESYTGGAAYRNGEPEEAQLALRLMYASNRMAAGVVQEALFWLKLCAAAAFLYVLPGWAVLSYFYSRWDEHRWAEKIGLAAGVSLVIYPLLYLWTDVIGLHLGALYAWLPPIIAAIALAIQMLRRKSARSEPSSSPGSAPGNGREALATYWSRFGLVDVAYLGLGLLVLISRFWAVRTLDLPMWGDSYHHTLVTQLLLDHSGLFDSWAPYAEMQTFTYHFGFHTLTTTLSYLTGLNAAQATLWSGQLINVLAVFCLVPLAVRMGRNPWAGVAALLLAGMLFPMPMSYTNWGRYTQLAGQVILAAVIFLSWEALEQEKIDRRLILLTGFVLGGLALTHLRVLIIAVLFLVAYGITRLRSRDLRSVALRGLVIVSLALLLFLPWLVHTYSGQIMAIFNSQITTPASQVPADTDQASSVGNLFEFLPALVWILLPGIIGWGLWRRERSVLLVSIWCWLAWVAGEPGWYGLPGTGAVTPFAILIAAYIPASMLYGAAAGWLIEGVWSGQKAALPTETTGQPTIQYSALQALLAVVAIGIGIWAFGMRQQDISISDHALALRPDLRAADWIRENLPQDAILLVNADLAFGESTTVGTDGGWWLPLTARRQTTIPPMNYSFERLPWPGYREWINSLYEQIDSQGVADPQVVDELRKRGVTHVYIGQQQGGVSFFGRHNFDLPALLSSPDYQPVYHQDRVWIFEVQPQ